MTSSFYAFARKAAQWIPSWIFRVQTKCVVYLPRERWIEGDSSGLRQATVDDTDELTGLVDRDLVESRFAREAMCVVAVDDDQIVGAMWFEDAAPMHESWLLIDLPDDVRWITDVVVREDRRGAGTAGRLGAYGRSLLPAEVAAVAALVTGLNEASRTAASKSRYGSDCVFYARLLGVTAVRLPSGWRIGGWREGRPLVVELSEFVA